MKNVETVEDFVSEMKRDPFHEGPGRWNLNIIFWHGTLIVLLFEHGRMN
jgi:hypothetical protein